MVYIIIYKHGNEIDHEYYFSTHLSVSILYCFQIVCDKCIYCFLRKYYIIISTNYNIL